MADSWKSKERSFSYYESIYRAGRGLTRRAQGSLALAVLEFYYDGKEPTDLPRDAKNVFEGLRYRIQRARSVSKTRGGSGSDGNSSDTTGQHNGYPQGTDLTTDTVAEYEHIQVPAETHFPPAEVPTEEPNDSMGFGIGAGSGVGSGIGQHNVGLPAGNPDPPLKNRTIEEKEEAVFNALGEDAASYDYGISRWVDRYHRAGWVDQNGDDMDELVTDERVPRWLCMIRGYFRGMKKKAGDSRQGTPNPIQQHVISWEGVAHHPCACHRDNCGGPAFWFTNEADKTNYIHCDGCGETYTVASTYGEAGRTYSRISEIA